MTVNLRRPVTITGGRIVALSAALVLAAAVLSAQADNLIRVHVSTATSDGEFVDNKARDREDAAKDIRESIQKKKKKTLRLVDSAEQADVLVAVTDRFVRDTDRVESTTTGSAGTNKQGDRAYGTSSTTARVIKEFVVTADLRVGDHVEPLEGAVADTYLFGGLWRTAAAQVADGVEEFAKNNRDRLLARRSR